MNREALMSATKEAAQSYRACAKSAEDARQMLALGMGTLRDVTAKSFLEANAYARWEQLAAQFSNVK